MMREYLNRHMAGILGTIIVHLIAVLIFMLVKVSVSYKTMADVVVLDNVEIKRLQDLLQEQKPQDQELLQDEKLWHNIAVNQAKNAKEEFDLDDYAEKVREQLIAEGAIQAENWEGVRKLANNLEKLQGQEPIEEVGIPETDSADLRRKKELAEMEDNYTGPTRITYYLGGRSKMYMPLPIYKCPGGGKVVVQIVVDPFGDVLETKIDTGQSDVLDECLTEAAGIAAKKSKFNQDASAPAKQTGSITYYFQAQ